MDIIDSDGFFGTLAETIKNWLGSIREIIDILGDSLDLPMRLSGYMPAIIGASITIVLFTMVVKFIIGR